MTICKSVPHGKPVAGNPQKLIIAALSLCVSMTVPALTLETVSGDVSRLRIGAEEIVTVRTNATVRFTGSGTVRVLLVGGGGGGGYIAGGGGGGGGVVAQDSVAVTAGTDYAITVGMGGTAAYYKSGNVYAKNGGDTTAFGLTAHGGGAGGTRTVGGDGASGGGGGAWRDTIEPYAGEKAGGQAIYGSEGFAGGSCTNIGRFQAYGGGGGGAGGPAVKWILPSNLDGDATYGIAGQGGDGVFSSISGTAMYYGGGGGGGAAQEHQFAHGGLGGGGRGGAYGLIGRLYTGTAADATGMPGTDGLGGGGGGGAALNEKPGGKGGDGVVIFRYAIEEPASGTQTMTIVDGCATSKVSQYNMLVTVYSNSILRVANRATFDILLVGGGGSGATNGGGGGGGGGVVYLENVSVEPGDYGVVVGAGGVSDFEANKDDTGDGGDTTAFGLIAHGGGGGGRKYYGANGASGGGGGSAGGGNYRGARNGTIFGEYAGGSAIYGDQGFGGGSCTNVGYWYDYGGGGGGAGGAGENAVRYYASSTDNGKAGDGGIGKVCSITGEAVYYGGGGGGGAAYCVRAASGGLGGGGAGEKYNSSAQNEAGTDFLGGGGGGGASVSGSAGKRGGCGVVIIRYRNAVPEERPTLNPGDATGGEFVRRRGYGLHSFTNDGSFVVAKDTVVDVLLVGGGGGGGNNGGGGGGGGGVRFHENVLIKAGTYAVTIGVGGEGGQNGENSEFIGFVAYGGGAGGYRATGSSGATGGGGGAWGDAYKPEEGMFPGGVSAYPEQGFGGGACTNTGRWCSYGGGGGGAGAVGGSAVRYYASSTDDGMAGAGGAGRTCSITFKDVVYGGGGGGGCCRCVTVASGGAGGGGAGGAYEDKTHVIKDGEPEGYGQNGTDGYGGGGGGAAMLARTASAGKGGCGRVIIRYKFTPKGMMVLLR